MQPVSDSAAWGWAEIVETPASPDPHDVIEATRAAEVCFQQGDLGRSCALWAQAMRSANWRASIEASPALAELAMQRAFFCLDDEALVRVMSSISDDVAGRCHNALTLARQGCFRDALRVGDTFLSSYGAAQRAHWAVFTKDTSAALEVLARPIGRDQDPPAVCLATWSERVWLDAFVVATKQADPEPLLGVIEEARRYRASMVQYHARRGLKAWRSFFANDTGGAEGATEELELLEMMATSLAADRRRAFLQAHAPTQASSVDEKAGGDDHAPILRVLKTLGELLSTRDTPSLLERIVDGALLLSKAQRGYVLLVDEHGRLSPQTVRSVRLRAGDEAAKFSQTIALSVLIDGTPIVTVDAREDERISDHRTAHRLQLKSVACLPIRGRERVCGVLYLEDRDVRGLFLDVDMDLLNAYAHQAALVIETTQLIEQLENRQALLKSANEELERTRLELQNALEHKERSLDDTRKALTEAKQALRDKDELDFFGQSEALQRLRPVFERVVQTDLPVVIHGETGTGKTTLAKRIHTEGKRAAQPWVVVSCGAIPETLLEAELFGHAAGSFTGAHHDREGAFARAHKGSLFLDEVDAMPPKMQSSILRALQEGKIRPVGADEEIEIDVRVITASREPLARLVERGEFREDLYYRLSVVELLLPPLRERREDIVALSHRTLVRLAKREQIPVRRLSRAALSVLTMHDWPGNIRQLEHVLTNACIMASGDVIEVEDLSITPAADSPTKPPAARRSAQDYKAVEKDKILQALEAHGWNKARAARALGMARRTFYRRLHQYRIAFRDDEEASR